MMSSEIRVWVGSQSSRVLRDFDLMVVLQEAKPFMSFVPGAEASSASIDDGGGGWWMCG